MSAASMVRHQLSEWGEGLASAPRLRALFASAGSCGARRSACAVVFGLTLACSGAAQRSGSLVRTGLAAPVAWLSSALPACPNFDSTLGVIAGVFGDVDGDGSADVIGSTCDPHGRVCVMQLCLGSSAGQLLLAASWSSRGLDWVQPFAGAAPRSFDAYPAIATGACFSPRRFEWADDGADTCRSQVTSASATVDVLASIAVEVRGEPLATSRNAPRFRAWLRRLAQ
jgi:hypothetical protein